ncbi:hypothetical protein BJX99DRAFT_264773 [Aspergillus californicus]
MEQQEVMEEKGKEKVVFPYDVLRYTNEESAPLEEQIKHVKTRFKMLASYIEQMMMEDEFLKSDEFERIRLNASGFAHYWVHEPSDDNYTWTQSQKKHLVASLDGYCVQEDFDSIASRLSLKHRKQLPSLLATAFLVKTAVEKFYKHPFWYLEVLSDGEEQNEELPWQGVLPDGALLESIFSQFEKGMSLSCSTSDHRYHVRPYLAKFNDRLCNTMYAWSNKNPDFGKALKARRRARCRSLAKEILADKTFQYLLKPTDDLEKREHSLGLALGTFANSAICMLSQNPSLGFKGIHELEPRVDHASENTEAFWDYQLEEGDATLDGHRVLFIEHPYVYRIGNDTEEGEVIVVCKAPALLEEHRSTEEDSAKASKQPKNK